MRLMLGSDPAPAQAAGTVPDSRFESATFLRQVVVGKDASPVVHWQPYLFSLISQSRSPTAVQCKAAALTARSGEGRRLECPRQVAGCLRAAGSADQPETGV